MKILLGSTNPSKLESLKLALNELFISEYEILTFKVESGVSSKPLDEEIIAGADNRNQALKAIAKSKNIEYDYLCSIEGGFSLEEWHLRESGEDYLQDHDDDRLPFVVTYCVVEDKNGRKSTGQSLGIRLTRKMYDYVKYGGSLNKIIELINNENDNKQKDGITGYLSDGLFNRSRVDKDSVISSFLTFVYEEKRKKFDEKIPNIY